MRDAATQDRRSNERAKLWIFRKIVKWKRWRHAPRLTWMADLTAPRCHFSKRCHVAAVKNIAGDDQATLMVDRNSAICWFMFTKSQLTLRRRLRGWRRLPDVAQMAGSRRQKYRRRRPGNPNGPSKFRKYSVYLPHFYICLRLQDRDCCSAADGNGSCHTPASSYFEEMTHCRYKKFHWRWRATLTVDRNSAIYVYKITTNDPAAALRLMAASGDCSNGT